MKVITETRLGHTNIDIYILLIKSVKMLFSL